jgi:flagellar protein FlaG
MDTLSTVAGIQPLAPSSSSRSLHQQATPGSETQTPPSGLVQAAGQQQTVGPTNKSEPGTFNEKKERPDKQQVTEAVKNVNEFFQLVRRTLQFKIDEDSGRSVIQIKDEETNKVIRQIPSEEILRIAKELDRLKGLLFEGKV